METIRDILEFLSKDYFSGEKPVTRKELVKALSAYCVADDAAVQVRFNRENSGDENPVTEKAAQ